ncbi:VOC family protein [Arthrobacter sp. W1]|nr:hypothetical protein RN04_06085 [Arthrobacter sp. W1]
MTNPESLSPARVDHVGLSVADLDGMLRWYADAFGMTCSDTFDVPALQLRGAFLNHPNGLTLELIERVGSIGQTPANDQAESLLRRGYAHLCLAVEDVDRTHGWLLTCGAQEKMAPCPSPEPGVRMSFLADPEGNFIELIDRKEPRS